MSFCGVFGCMSTPVWGPIMYVYKQTSFKKGPTLCIFPNSYVPCELMIESCRKKKKSLSELSSDMNFCYSNTECLCSILDCSLLGLCMRKKGPTKKKRRNSKCISWYPCVWTLKNSQQQEPKSLHNYTAAKSLKQILHFKESDSKAFRRPRSQVLCDLKKKKCIRLHSGASCLTFSQFLAPPSSACTCACT